MGVTHNKCFWMSNKGHAGNMECVLVEDDPPTKVSQQNCFKVRASFGANKYGKIPLFVTTGSNGVKVKSKGVDGVVYLTLLQEHKEPAREAPTSKIPLAEAQY